MTLAQNLGTNSSQNVGVGEVDMSVLVSGNGCGWCDYWLGGANVLVLVLLAMASLALLSSLRLPQSTHAATPHSTGV